MDAVWFSSFIEVPVTNIKYLSRRITKWYLSAHFLGIVKNGFSLVSY